MFENEYLYWNNRDQKTLVHMIDRGASYETVARKLRRTPSACMQRYNQIQIGLMVVYGNNDTNVREFKKEKHNVNDRQKAGNGTTGRIITLSNAK